MKAIVSILSAVFAGAIFFQGYLAIWDPSPFGRFVHLREILFYSAAITTASYLVLIVPIHLWLRHHHRQISSLSACLAGLALGCVAMFIFMLISGWPVHTIRLIAGGIAGAVGFSVYARLCFSTVA